MFASLSDDFANISITYTAPSKTFNLAGLQVSNIFIPNETLRFKFKKAVDAAGYRQVNVMGSKQAAVIKLPHLALCKRALPLQVQRQHLVS